jgi:hypothetical protein
MSLVKSPLCPKVCVIRNLNNQNEQHSGIDDKYWNEKDLSHYQLKEKIEEFVDFIEILDTNDLFNLINIIIQPNNEYIINIDDFYYTSDYVYQAIFKLPANQKSYNTQIEESNKLAIQLLNEKFFVNGNMIVIKRSIINNDFDYVDIMHEDITEILKSQFLHKAIIIETNQKIIESTYIFNALEINFNQSHLDNSRFFEYRFLEYRLFFHIDKNADRNNNNLNIIASIIYGKKIYGNVLISLCDNSDSSPQPLNITKELLNKIFYLSLNQKLTNSEIDRKKYSRNLNLDNKTLDNIEVVNINKFNHNNFPEIILCPNFYHIIKNEYNLLNLEDLNSINLNEQCNFELVLNDIE